MSAGAFVNSRYQATYSTTQIHPIRVQPETLAATITPAGGGTPIANDPPVDAATSPLSAQVSKSTRSLGLHARLVTIKIPVGGTPPTGYLAGSTVRLPAVSPAFFAAANTGASVSYLAATWEVIGRRAEVTR